MDSGKEPGRHMYHNAWSNTVQKYFLNLKTIEEHMELTLGQIYFGPGGEKRPHSLY